MLKNMSILQVNVNIVSVISQSDTVLAMNWLNLGDSLVIVDVLIVTFDLHLLDCVCNDSITIQCGWLSSHVDCFSQSEIVVRTSEMYDVVL